MTISLTPEKVMINSEKVYISLYEK
jgi:hypothetical protein